MEEIIGNFQAKAKLNRFLNSKNEGPCLLSGTYGVGKFTYLKNTLSQIVSESSISVISPDLNIDEIRDIVQQSSFHSSEKFRATIIRDADMLSFPARDCLLKAIEDTKSSFFIIATDKYGFGEPLLSRVRYEISWGSLKQSELFELVSDDLAVKISFGSAADCLKANSMMSLKDIYQICRKDDWPFQALRFSPKLFEKADLQERRCISNLFRLVSRDSKYRNNFLSMSSKISSIPTLNISNQWFMEASSALERV